MNEVNGVERLVMRNCIDCKYADWEKTKTGRLHPSGDGRCIYQYKVPALPASMYWLGRSDPSPLGGHITRRKELKEHCAYYGA